MKKEYYSARETAEALNLSYLTVIRKAKSKEFPSVRVCRKILIPTTFLEDLKQKAMSSVAV